MTTERELLRLLAAQRVRGLHAPRGGSRKNILVSGPTGSGKTTWTKALIREIPADGAARSRSRMPRSSCSTRIRITCGSFTPRTIRGSARVTPKQLLESCLRMKPDRILLAELRAEEAFDYLRNVNSGHPGSITSIHAGSCELAFEQLVLLVKQSPGGRELARARHQESAVSPGRCRHPVRRRAPRALHQGDLV